MFEHITSSRRFYRTYEDRNNAGGLGAHDQTSTDITIANSHREGSSVSNYRALIASGNDASSEYTRYSQSISAKDGFSHLVYADNVNYPGSMSGGTAYFSGCVPAHFFAQNEVEGFIQNLSDSARALLNVRFLNKLRSTYQSMDGSTFIGEFTEALHGLRHPAYALRHGLSDYLSTINKRAKGLSKSKIRAVRRKSLTDMVAGTWLEYNFGFRPLLSDIASAGKAIENTLDTFGFTSKSIHCSISEKFSRPRFHEGVATFLFHFDVFYESISETSQRLSGVVKREINRPYTFQEQLGLTPDNWIPALWEVLPFSFVADYFVNIGSCLSAAGTSTTGLHALCLSTRSSRTVTREALGDKSLDLYIALPGTYPWESYVSYGGKISIHSLGFHRAVLDPLADLYVWPTLNFPTMPTQWMNLEALALQARNTSVILKQSLR